MEIDGEVVLGRRDLAVKLSADAKGDVPEGVRRIELLFRVNNIVALGEI
jgi:hypothetical protein